MVEPQPSKLIVRVRFPSPAPLSYGKTNTQRQTPQDSAVIEIPGMDAGLFLAVMEDRINTRSRSSVGRAPPW